MEATHDHTAERRFDIQGIDHPALVRKDLQATRGFAAWTRALGARDVDCDPSTAAGASAGSASRF